ncbi:ankyrin repeat-containing domain protein [Cercophora newfieldiana]|uniref:Ankyrin repeat-containing domain protein n=1 Tax=Cercophora newfieldiana TaxID=92897 RepID=A0AA40CJK0_9PEZI|nr:ankyrin repeat-containing domain protein [Cercophora newfieldiana]
MHDICDMFSTAPSSKMTAQTRRSYDSLLFKMAPQVQIENHIVTACKAGKSQELKYLLGLDRPPASNRSKRIALMRAVQGASLRHNNCVRTLIDAGINVDAVSYTSGKTALHWALENDDFHGYTNLIMLLVDPACGGANPNRHDYNGDYPLTKIFSDSGSAPLGQHRLSALAILLKQANIDVNVAVPGSDNTPLHLAVRRQDSRAVAMLLYKGADVNAKNSAGATPLQVAANQFRGEMGSNHAEVLDLLLRHGAMVDERAGALGRTALHLAAASGTAHAVEVLLKHNASVTLKDTNGLDAMSLAVQHASKLTANENRPEDDRLSDHVDMMQQLNDATECGWPMKEGKCPVQIAIEDGDGNLLKKLLHYKLDLGSRYLGGTVREYAARFENDAAKSLQ